MSRGRKSQLQGFPPAKADWHRASRTIVILIQVSTKIVSFVEKIEITVLEWPTEVYVSIGECRLYFIQKGTIMNKDN